MPAVQSETEGVLRAVDQMIAAVRTDDKLEDDEAQAIVQLMQDIEDRFADLLAHYGVEIGDERID